MAITARTVNGSDGKQIGYIHTFENAGDEYPIHTHPDEGNHFTFILYGEAEYYGSLDGQAGTLKPEPGGTGVKWKAGQYHGFRAKVAGTALFHVNLAAISGA